MLLMTPGPTRVPDRVLAAGARPMIHHRTAEFSAELAEMLELLQPVFGTNTVGAARAHHRPRGDGGVDLQPVLPGRRHRRVLQRKVR